MAFREDWDELVSAARIVAEQAVAAIVTELGFDPVVCRVSARSWRILIDGSALWLECDEEGRLVRVATAVAMLPPHTGAGFFRFLLTANDRSAGPARLSLERDVVMASLVEPVDMLDVVGVRDSISEMLAFAKRLHDVLHEAFGARAVPPEL